MIQKLVGISFNPIKDDTIKKGTELNLVHDKDNQYSLRAVAVMYGDKKLGHIGEKGNEAHEEIFKALPLKATVAIVNRLAEGEEFGRFKPGEITHLEVEFPMNSDKQDGIESFNEPGIFVQFDPIPHRYLYKGEQLIGGSTYIKKWIKEFDKERISAIYADNMGFKQSEVLAFWESGGKVAADFGTAIHQAMEHYEKYKKMGKIIQEKKDLPFNKAMPSHPALRKIVEEFVAKFGDSDVLTEVFVTNVEQGICGMIDRLLVLDSKKKICRVQDYKVNIGSEDENKDKFLGQFADLPKNKLSKYQLQLSVYARMLQLSGWNVQGLDAYVYENEWKHYPMEILKLDF